MDYSIDKIRTSRAQCKRLAMLLVAKTIKELAGLRSRHILAAPAPAPGPQKNSCSGDSTAPAPPYLKILDIP